MSNLIYNNVVEVYVGRETIYTVMIVENVDNTINYINIRKVTNNPFNGLGNDYKSFDDVYRKYKNKRFVRQIEDIQFKYETNKILKDNNIQTI